MLSAHVTLDVFVSDGNRLLGSPFIKPSTSQFWSRQLIVRSFFCEAEEKNVITILRRNECVRSECLKIL